MPKLTKHERFSLGETRPLAPTFLDDLAAAHALGLRHPIGKADLGLKRREYGVDLAVVRKIKRLGRGDDGARNALWVAFYQGLIRQRGGATPRWQCIIQQQLTKALARIADQGVSLIMGAHSTFDLGVAEWRRECVGALAVARVACAFAAHGGPLHLPHPMEDIRGKIDLIYQEPSLERGFCLQVKSDSKAAETSAVLVDEAAAEADGTGYLSRMLRGMKTFRRYQPGLWTPVLLIVRQVPSVQSRDCPHLARVIRDVLALP